MLDPLLHRLDRFGYVTKEWRTPPERRRRRYYAITDQTVTRALGDVWGGADLLPVGAREGLTVERLESEIAEWRAGIGQGPGIDGRAVEELEAHLRDQIAVGRRRRGWR